MKIFKKTIIFIMALVTLNTAIIESTNNNICINAQIVPQKTINAVVLLSSFDNAYISLVRQNLEKIQNENKGMVNFMFFDSKGNQDIQNEILDSVLATNFDLLLVNLVDISENTVTALVSKVKEKNVPLLLFNVAPFVTDSIKSYPKALVIATNAAQSGILEGQLLINEWNTNKEAIDKNKDNILEYVIIKSRINTTLTSARTKYSISAINDAGIKTQELASIASNGGKEATKAAFDPAFLRLTDKIEAIIANDDTMAIGTIEVLQKYGYNMGNKEKTIPVVGIDGIPEAINLIKRRAMAGTVIQDSSAMAEALYKVGMNLAYNKNPLDNTNYKFNETGVVIEMPYSKYKVQ